MESTSQSTSQSAETVVEATVATVATAVGSTVATVVGSTAVDTPPAAAAAVAPSSPWFGRNVYVRNLPPVNPLTMEMPSEVHVMNLFARFGALEKLRVIRDRVTGLPTGHALILFKSPESAQAAIQYINHGFIYMPMLVSKPSATLWLPKEVFQT